MNFLDEWCIWWQCIIARARGVIFVCLFVLFTCFYVEGYGEITQPRADLIQVFWDVMPC